MRARITIDLRFDGNAPRLPLLVRVFAVLVAQLLSELLREGARSGSLATFAQSRRFDATGCSIAVWCCPLASKTVTCGFGNLLLISLSPARPRSAAGCTLGGASTKIRM